MLELRNKKTITLIIVILVAIAALSLIVTLNKKDRGIPIHLDKVPKDLILSVDGQNHSGSTIYVSEGTHKITGEKDGFESYTYDITIKSGTPTKTLFFILTPRSDEARQWATENQTLYSEAGERAGAAAAEEGEDFAGKYPIVKKLPYRGSMYNIDYYYNGETDEFRVQITSPDAFGRQVALDTIRLWGYEPTDYTIEFLGYVNPFASSNKQTKNEVTNGD